MKWKAGMLETVLARSRGISILNPARQEMKVIGKGDGAEFGAPLLQIREERVAARPKTHSEQAILLRNLIDQASELPPIPLSPAYQRRWALEFEGQSLKTYRRMPDSR